MNPLAGIDAPSKPPTWLQHGIRADRSDRARGGASPTSVQTTIDTQMRDLIRACGLGSAASQGVHVAAPQPRP
jgi:hypothetical protein